MEYLYTYNYHPDEKELCQMEMRAFLQKDCADKILKSEISVDPTRSPFIIGRLEVLLESDDFQDVIDFSKGLKSTGTYRVHCLNNQDFGRTLKIPHSKRRKLERELGMNILGEPDLHNPEVHFGVLQYNDNWYFGIYEKSEQVWLQHVEKPNQFSTALNTKVARAVMNILAPFPEGKRYIDPCCGIGTVVIEGLSMGIDIIGRDLKPLVCKAARENLAYFQLDGKIVKGDISEITNFYDGAIIDLPYNIFTHTSEEALRNIFRSARKISKRVLFIAIEDVSSFLEENGFTVIDQCVVRKRHFKRQILLCE